MSLSITSLNSGSNGNCYYVGNDKEAVLIDAGISCRETEKRMMRLGLSMNKVKAIFVSHEHSDHIRGIPVLAKKYKLPVYITSKTLAHCYFNVELEQVKSFEAHRPTTIGSLTITAFSKFHDAIEPHSFVVSCNEIKVGVFTDIGVPCKHLTHYFDQCHAAFLEANYDEELLDKGGYPIYLKNLIRGGKGHLSNKQALQFFTTYRPKHLTHLVLSHLSKHNNCPDLVYNLFTEHAAGTKIVVATRYNETEVLNIGANVYNEIVNTKLQTASVTQMALF
jgi:phosphoribosyl 1,2-cyclic phosphodiesterase